MANQGDVLEHDSLLHIKKKLNSLLTNLLEQIVLIIMTPKLLHYISRKYHFQIILKQEYSTKPLVIVF